MAKGLELECLAVSCGYLSQPVLTDVQLRFGPGVTVLLGPNGSGKTTLLKTLARTLKPLAGEIHLQRRPLGEIPQVELARMIAFVPQEEHVPFDFTVREVVVMGRLPYSSGLFDTADDHRLASAAMEEADCLDYEARPMTQLSGGERQRALLARAIVQDADVLLLDEPSAHLDVRHQSLVLRLLRRLAAEGKTIVAAVHDLNLASQLGDAAVVLNGGRVLAQGACQQIMSDQALETAYGVRFQRIAGEDGRLRMLPQL